MKLRFPRIRLPSRAAWAVALDLACLVAGAAALARGLWLIYPPATWVVLGLLLIASGLPLRGRGS